MRRFYGGLAPVRFLASSLHRLPLTLAPVLTLAPLLTPTNLDLWSKWMETKQWLAVGAHALSDGQF